MSIAEELQRTIEELTEEQQQQLLETARELLEDKEDANELNDELKRRYEHLRQHPGQVVNARESNHQLRQKHGW